MPSIAHIIYIPGVLLIGLAFGFRLGARAVRAELERRDLGVASGWTWSSTWRRRSSLDGVVFKVLKALPDVVGIREVDCKRYGLIANPRVSRLQSGGIP